MVAIGWNIGDLTNKTRNEIKELTKKKYGKNTKSDYASNQIIRFIFDIEVGDYVITHNYPEGSYLLVKLFLIINTQI